MGEWSKARTHCAWCGEPLGDVKLGTCFTTECPTGEMNWWDDAHLTPIAQSLRGRIEELEIEHAQLRVFWRREMGWSDEDGPDDGWLDTSAAYQDQRKE